MEISKIAKLFLITIFMALCCINVSVYAAQGEEEEKVAVSEVSHEEGSDESVGVAGANRSKLNITPEDWLMLPQLMKAVISADHETVNTLVGNKANVNQMKYFGLPAELHTSLKCAVRLGDVNSARLLIDAGAHIEPKELKDRQLIIEAAMEGNVPMMRLLIEKKADVTVEDQDGFNALAHAACNGNIEVMKLLLAAGVQVSENTLRVCMVKQYRDFDTIEVWCNKRVLAAQLLVASDKEVEKHIAYTRDIPEQMQTAVRAIIDTRSVIEERKQEVAEEMSNAKKEVSDDASDATDLIVRHLVDIEEQRKLFETEGVAINRWRQEGKEIVRKHQIRGQEIGELKTAAVTTLCMAIACLQM